MTEKRLIVSVDVERDIPRFFKDSYESVEDVLGGLLSAIRDHGFVPDLFVESRVVKRYPDLVRGFRSIGHSVGWHGEHLDPLLATQLAENRLDEHLQRDYENFRAAFGEKPRVFREANFAVDRRTLQILSRLGIAVDSSILPNRRVRGGGLHWVVDHARAPPGPYRPSPDDHRLPGGNRLIEIPVTENPLNPGNPIGTGFLNLKGVEATVAALKGSEADPITFLIHPWECMNLGAKKPTPPKWVLEMCDQNQAALKALFTTAAEIFQPSCIRDVVAEYGVVVA